MKKPFIKSTSSSSQEQVTYSKSTSSASEIATQIKTLLKKQNQQESHTQLALLAPTTALAEQNDANRLDELRRIFSKLQSNSELSLSSHQLSTKKNGNNAVKEKWNTWLKKQHGVYMSQLSHAIQDGRKSTLRTFMGVIASSPIKEQSQQQQQQLHNQRKVTERMNPNLIQQLITALIQPNNEDGIVPEYMVDMLDNDFISKYRDVQYYTLTSIKLIAQRLYDQIEKDEKEQAAKKKKKKSSSSSSSKKRKKQDGDDNGSNDSDNDDEEEEDGIDHDIIGVYAENLMRILLKVQIADDQLELNPVDVKVTDGTCSNYLFLPSNYQSGEEEDDDDDNDDDDVDYSDDETNDKKTTDEKNNKNKQQPKLSPMQSMRKHRYALQEATLAILKLPNLPPRALKLALQHFPSNILPNASNPLRYADFCTRAYDMGGITSLLALNSLFILMLQCGLEYKDFYPSLYNLIEPKIFYAKYRTRFFKLLVKCLSGNQMLPAYLIAAFCKKLCRCALNAPPSGALFVLALVSNLLRKHEECACIIHRNGPTKNQGKMKDAYDYDERDPAKSKAIESSLWELHALEQHYHPAVSGMAKGCGMEDGQQLMHNLDEFLLHTYKSLFDQERKRAGNKRDKKLPLTFHKPSGLFVDNDVFDGVFDFPKAKKQKV